MTPDRIAALLSPFEVELDDHRLKQISIYIDLLLRWNSRVNLTAIRAPEEIVTRHFGESLFLARILFPAGSTASSFTGPLIDVGSGSGFPGLAIKLWAPQLPVILVESHQKKATFLREVIRALTLTGINVQAVRAETLPPASAAIVTLRAVERFQLILPTAAALVSREGRLAMLIGASQVEQTLSQIHNFTWQTPIFIPTSQSRQLLIGQSQSEPNK